MKDSFTFSFNLKSLVEMPDHCLILKDTLDVYGLMTLSQEGLSL